MHNLAASYQVQGRHVEAETLLREALLLLLRREELGSRQPVMPASTRDPAAPHRAQGHPGDAEPPR